jgi:hypothetical protein
MIRLVFYGWKISKESRTLFERMEKALLGILRGPHDPIKTEIIDVATYGEIDHSEGWGLVFGKAAKQVTDCNGQLLGMPDEELLGPGGTNRPYREAAMETLKAIADHACTTKEEAPTKVAVRKDNVTVGQEDADIIIPEGTLRYIQQIRDLLGGGAIEITKGDLKIEIKEKL